MFPEPGSVTACFEGTTLKAEIGDRGKVEEAAAWQKQQALEGFPFLSVTSCTMKSAEAAVTLFSAASSPSAYA